MTTHDLRALYQTSRWRRARAAFLRLHPICSWPMCSARSTVVDHVVPRSTAANHVELEQLTWDRDNWQPFCKPHHDEKTRREQGRRRRGAEVLASSAVITRDYSRGVA